MLPKLRFEDDFLDLLLARMDVGLRCSMVRDLEVGPLIALAAVLIHGVNADVILIQASLRVLHRVGWLLLWKYISRIRDALSVVRLVGMVYVTTMNLTLPEACKPQRTAIQRYLI